MSNPSDKPTVRFCVKMVLASIANFVFWIYALSYIAHIMPENAWWLKPTGLLGLLIFVASVVWMSASIAVLYSVVTSNKEDEDDPQIP